MGFSILARKGLCSIMISCSFWFRLGFRCLSPFFSLLPFPGKGFCSIMMSWLFVVLARVPVLVSLSSLFVLFSGKGFCSIMVLVPPGSGSGSGACLSSAFFLLYSGVISWSFLVPAGVPVLASLFSFLRKGVLFHHDVLVPFGSGSGSGACFPSSLFFLVSGMAFCSTIISWFLVVPALVPVLVSLLLSSFFS